MLLRYAIMPMPMLRAVTLPIFYCITLRRWRRCRAVVDDAATPRVVYGC